MSFSGALLDDFRESLLRKVNSGRAVEAAFAAWLQRHIPAHQHVLSELAERAVSHVGAQRSYLDVAISGYAVASGIPTIDVQAFRSSVEWLTGRPGYPGGVPAGFEDDPVAMLGVVLGAIHAQIPLEPIAEWLKGLRRSVSQEPSLGSTESALEIVLSTLTGTKGIVTLPDGELDDVWIAFHAAGLLSRDHLPPSAEENALRIIRTTEAPDVPRAALRVVALDWLRSQAPTALTQHPTVEDVVRLLRRVPAGFAKWTWEERPRTKNGIARQWHVDNEYHVQNFLWLVLAPVFPDLKAEDYTPQVGQTQPRADLGIPSLRLIVEVKFVRAGKSFADVINEISADTGLYLTPTSAYSEIVPFIWDDSRRSEQHEKLVQGLRQIRGISDAVVMSRPGAMIASPANGSTSRSESAE